jgi:hypothetical protein
VSPAEILSRLRRFLLALSALLFAGALVELWLVGHTEDTVQLLPFALCGAGEAAALLALLRPRRAAFIFLRVCMALAVAGSLLGVYLHVEGNFMLEREVAPGAATGAALFAALGGGNPLLAPGVLAVAALLALAATYKHSAPAGDKQVD